MQRSFLKTFYHNYKFWLVFALVNLQRNISYYHEQMKIYLKWNAINVCENASKDENAWKSTKSLENFSSTQSRDFSRFHSIETIRIFNITEPCQRLKWIHSFLVQIRTMNSTWFKLFNAENFQLPFTNRCTNLLIHLPLDTMINGNPAISIGVCLLLSVVHTIQSE